MSERNAERDALEWQIDRDAGELVGPCGCRVPNTFDGLMQARLHRCTSDKHGQEATR